MTHSRDRRHAAAAALWGIGFAALSLCEIYAKPYMSWIVWGLYGVIGIMLAFCFHSRETR
jgi:hypothetical protein